MLCRQGKLEQASAHYIEALRLNPGYGDAHDNLGEVLCRQGKFADASAHFAEALRLNPDDSEAHDNRAKLMAACPLAEYRDGNKAVEFATRACELTEWKNPGFLDTLAAAHAQAGDFAAAETWQTTAISLLPDERKKDDYRSRLMLYQARKPYRLPGK